MFLASKGNKQTFLTDEELASYMNKIYSEDIIKRMELIDWLHSDLDTERSLHSLKSFIKPAEADIKIKITSINIA